MILRDSRKSYTVVNNGGIAISVPLERSNSFYAASFQMAFRVLPWKRISYGGILISANLRAGYAVRRVAREKNQITRGVWPPEDFSTQPKGAFPPKQKRLDPNRPGPFLVGSFPFCVSTYQTPNQKRPDPTRPD